MLRHRTARVIRIAHGVADFKGRPLGSDCSNVYAADCSALHGSATAPFDASSQYAQEKALFGQATPFCGWHSQPYFLLIADPLALLSYPWALTVWQLATLALYLGALSTLLRTHTA